MIADVKYKMLMIIIWTFAITFDQIKEILRLSKSYINFTQIVLLDNHYENNLFYYVAFQERQISTL